MKEKTCFTCAKKKYCEIYQRIYPNKFLPNKCESHEKICLTYDLETLFNGDEFLNERKD